MKKIASLISIMLAVVFLVSCGKDNSGAGNKPAVSTPAINESTFNIPFKTTVKSQPGTELGFIWTAKDANFGTIEMSEAITATEEDLKDTDLKAPLVYKPEITTFTTFYTVDAEGNYVAEGTINMIRSSVEGESADAYIKMLTENIGNSKYEQATLKVLEGGILLETAEIEAYIGERDTTFKVTFTVKDGVMNITEFVRSYTLISSKRAVRDVYKIENGTIRLIESYKNEALDSLISFRADGTIEKESKYSNGEVVSVTEYDEKGNKIEK